MKLTDEQAVVVGIESGRHLVLAPPGSGKTEMLSQRILRALEAGVDPSRMLCATFTNRAAFEMRARVEGAAPGRTLPEVGNLHHFCHRFLMSVGRVDAAKHVLDEVSQLEFVRECVDVLRQELRAGGAADIRKTHGVTVVGMIEGVKSREEPHALRLAHLREMAEGVFALYDEKDRSPYSDFLAAILIAHQRRLGFKSFETRSYPPLMFELVGEGVIGALARAYVGLKRKFHAVDFDDLVNDACLYLRKNPLPEEKRYLWVQIDEVQDLNPLQWEVVRALASDAAVRVYFGDVEQAIFSFLGASVSRFFDEVRDCEHHYFKTNFRATPRLLELLMRFSIGCLRSEWEFLPSPSDLLREDGELVVSSSAEIDEAAAQAKAWLDAGVAENVAILVCENRTADQLEEVVRDFGYRTVKVSGRDLFGYAPMRDFMAFVNLVAGRATRVDEQALVRRFGGVCTTTQARYFVRSMRAAGWSLEAILGAGESEDSTTRSSRQSGWKWWHLASCAALRKSLSKSVRSLRARFTDQLSFREVFATFARLTLTDETLYSLAELYPEKAKEMMRDGLRAKDAVGRAFARIETFLRYADHVYEADTRSFGDILDEDGRRLSKLKEADLLVGDERIVISTIHKAKGRQFDAVVIPSAGGLLKGGTEGTDERLRLLYVAMSRAKRHLSLFHVDRDGELAKVVRALGTKGRSYYVRRAEGEDLSADWLSRWEALAQAYRCGIFPEDLARGAWVKGTPTPVMRMALKTVRFAGAVHERRSLIGELVSREELGDTRDVLLRLATEDRLLDAPMLERVRTLFVSQPEYWVRRASFDCFRLMRSEDSQVMRIVKLGIGDFIYSEDGELRYRAAQALAELGERCWRDVIKGTSGDWERIGRVNDSEHEPLIRALLRSKGSEGCHRILRRILEQRALR